MRCVAVRCGTWCLGAPEWMDWTERRGRATQALLGQEVGLSAGRASGWQSSRARRSRRSAFRCELDGSNKNKRRIATAPASRGGLTLLGGPGAGEEDGVGGLSWNWTRREEECAGQASSNHACCGSPDSGTGPAERSQAKLMPGDETWVGCIGGAGYLTMSTLHRYQRHEVPRNKYSGPGTTRRWMPLAEVSLYAGQITTSQLQQPDINFSTTSSWRLKLPVFFLHELTIALSHGPRSPARMMVGFN